MTRLAATALAITLLAAVQPPPAYAITARELRELAQKDEHLAQARAARAHPADPGSLLPESSDIPVTEPAKPAPAIVPAGHIEPLSPGTDSALPAHATGATIYSDAVPADTAHPFGIRLGRWIRARLTKNISSADPGLAELVITRTVTGDRRTLPAGTLIFARARVNGITRRMDLVAKKGITPGGREFKLKGLIFDTQGNCGLAGIVTDNMARALRRSTGKGILAAGDSALNALFGDGSPAAAGVTAVGGSILDTSDRNVDRTTSTNMTIYVTAQPVLVRIEATF